MIAGPARPRPATVTSSEPQLPLRCLVNRVGPPHGCRPFFFFATRHPTAAGANHCCQLARYICAMKSAIDSAGRVVIPKPLRVAPRARSWGGSWRFASGTADRDRAGVDADVPGAARGRPRGRPRVGAAAADRPTRACHRRGHASVTAVLTRLPPPHRAPPELVARFLAERFPDAPLLLPARAHAALVEASALAGLAGRTRPHLCW